MAVTLEMKQAYERLRVLQENSPWPQWRPEWITALKTLALQISAAQEAPWFPPIVYIEPTNACNCRCIICPRRRMTRARGYIDMPFFRRIVDQVATLGPSEIRLFNFGEPTLHRELPDMIRYCLARKLDARFQTNGLLLDRDYMTRLLEAGLTYLGVSVNGLNAEEYETIRPGKKYETVRTNLQQARALSRQTGKPLYIHINAQILQQDRHERQREIEAFAASWQDIADSLSVSGLSLYDRISFVEKGYVSEAALADIPRRADHEVRCTEPFDRMVVKWDGRVTPCCVDFDAQLVMGNLHRQSVREIWQSETFHALRRTIRTQAYAEIERCRTCPLFYSDRFTILFRKEGAKKKAAPEN
jgi:radical SAM protein with 4Fe4S-binding SPASM domain